MYSDNEIEMQRPYGHFRALNFERYAAEGNRFINEVAMELDVDRNRAARITRAVLHAVRDRIPPNDAVEFGQGLPMAIKGVFFDRYDLSDVPVVIRHPEAFFDFICSKDGDSAYRDFPDKQSVEEALRGVFRVLERNMDYGQVEQVKHMMNREIVSLID
jgi:uncharacterized protein (DUF2267 family)